MSCRKTTCLLISLSVAAAFFLCGCAKPSQPETEQLPPQSLQSAQADPDELEPTAMQNLSPPKLEEIREAVARIYKDAVVVDANPDRKPLVGDFNGDGSQDLIVTVKPVESMLSEVNSEFANWIRVDARKAAPPATKEVKPLPKAEPVIVEKGDLLLAVIHGHGPAGWRNPEAQQTYLLRNAAGKNMKRLSIEEMLKKRKGGMKLPRLYGDVIEETLAGESGFLYWMGARYIWYSPQAAGGTVPQRAKR
ncbi:MAG: hypothetical protein L0229_10860 [Blastocatellia bacterium]|nr:hypothetical protein [Blastocatellia bacterium]